jgi:hypothetical protein
MFNESMKKKLIKRKKKLLKEPLSLIKDPINTITLIVVFAEDHIDS